MALMRLPVVLRCMAGAALDALTPLRWAHDFQIGHIVSAPRALFAKDGRFVCPGSDLRVLANTFGPDVLLRVERQFVCWASGVTANHGEGIMPAGSLVTVNKAHWYINPPGVGLETPTDHHTKQNV